MLNILKGVLHARQKKWFFNCSKLVQPHLVYCTQFWALYFQTDHILERVQKATKIVRSFWNMTYKRSLEKLGLFSLEKTELGFYNNPQKPRGWL